MMINALALAAPDIIPYFAKDHQAPGWREVAEKWMLTALIVAFIGMAVMVAIKFILKWMAPTPSKRVWSRTWAIIFILLGILPVAGAMWIIWALDNDFYTIVDVSGLMPGIFLSWVFYIFFMFLSHCNPWWWKDLR